MYIYILLYTPVFCQRACHSFLVLLCCKAIYVIFKTESMRLVLLGGSCFHCRHISSWSNQRVQCQMVTEVRAPFSHLPLTTQQDIATHCHFACLRPATFPASFCKFSAFWQKKSACFGFPTSYIQPTPAAMTWAVRSLFAVPSPFPNFQRSPSYSQPQPLVKSNSVLQHWVERRFLPGRHDRLWPQLYQGMITCTSN